MRGSLDKRRVVRNTVIETLEQRRMYSSSLSYDGNLSISSSSGADIVLVRVEVGIVRVDETHSGSVRPAKFYDAKRVHLITFSGLDGADTFTNNTPTPTILYGGNGNDTLNSGNSRDIVYGEAGNDFIQLFASDDWADGGSGNDTIVGFNGNDVIYGGSGNDSIWTQNGNDWARGGEGRDILVGGEGNDVLGGDGGSDSLWGQNGADSLYGGDGNDVLNGGQDGTRDVMYGNGGNDTFVTDWRWTGYAWENREYAGDYLSWTEQRDYWVNPA